MGGLKASLIDNSDCLTHPADLLALEMPQYIWETTATSGLKLAPHEGRNGGQKSPRRLPSSLVH